MEWRSTDHRELAIGKYNYKNSLSAVNLFVYVKLGNGLGLMLEVFIYSTII